MVAEATVRRRHAVEGLTPGYFALVMASGIISVGLQLEGFHVALGAWAVVLVAMGRHVVRTVFRPEPTRVAPGGSRQ